MHIWMLYINHLSVRALWCIWYDCVKFFAIRVFSDKQNCERESTGGECYRLPILWKHSFSVSDNTDQIVWMVITGELIPGRDHHSVSASQQVILRILTQTPVSYRHNTGSSVTERTLHSADVTVYLKNFKILNIWILRNTTKVSYLTDMTKWSEYKL